MKTELPSPVERFNPDRYSYLPHKDMIHLYNSLYAEYLLMVEAYARAGEHVDSLHTRMLESIKQSDHWHTQYHLLLKKNERLQMPTYEERKSGQLSPGCGQN